MQNKKLHEKVKQHLGFRNGLRWKHQRMYKAPIEQKYT